MAIVTQTRRVGDTQIAIAATLKRPADGSVVDLTSLTPKFAMYDADGAAKVAETTDNVAVISATDGTVKYSPQAADVDTPGVFFAQFITEDGSSKQETFPAERGEFRIDIQRPAYTE